MALGMSEICLPHYQSLVTTHAPLEVLEHAPTIQYTYPFVQIVGEERTPGYASRLVSLS